MYYSKFGEKWSGFTNQIYSLITNIILSHKEKIKVVIVDKFWNDYSKDNYTPISEIFNLEKINAFLKDNYDMFIFDKYNIQFELLSVKYGSGENIIDLTYHINEKYYNNDIYYINQNTDFNTIAGDPCVGTRKNIFLQYKINGYEINEKLDEKLTHDFNTDFLNTYYTMNFGWPNDYNDNMFDKILTHITFHDDFIKKADNIVSEIDIHQKVNVIHLRIEEDAIRHWSKQNNMSESDFKSYIENKYIELFQKYISVTDENILLSDSISNSVVDFLIQNNYQFKFNRKYFDEREKNAIVDLLTTKYCNNIFIGNFNFLCGNGSTFSYYISKCIHPDVKKISIDLDRIHDDECNYY